jgi:hypothetical protein
MAAKAASRTVASFLPCGSSSPALVARGASLGFAFTHLCEGELSQLTDIQPLLSKTVKNLLNFLVFIFVLTIKLFFGGEVGKEYNIRGQVG